MRPVCRIHTARTHTPPWSEQSYALQKRTIDELSCDSVLKWWKRWMSSYPLLARAARVVFGAPASAAVLEGDFGDAGRIMTSSRSTTDAKYVEMILFLHGNLDLIPEDIPACQPTAPSARLTNTCPGG
ncbi:unnamed protein product [Ectocarpus sp. CCAP 1310/34]|nr:unnamed protein product [Ectocarpus sp. CCAP 1310/34]